MHGIWFDCHLLWAVRNAPVIIVSIVRIVSVVQQVVGVYECNHQHENDTNETVG